MGKKQGFFLTFRMSILSAFIVLLFFSTGLIIFFSYFNALSTMDQVSKELILNISNQTIDKTVKHISPAMEMSFLISKDIKSEKNLLNNFERFEELSILTMKLYPQLEAINCGFDNNNFYMLKKEGNKTISTKIIRRDVPKPYVEWVYRNLQGKELDRKRHYEPVYLPTKRPWYIGAKQNKSYFMSDVYVFFTDRVPGVTIGHPIFDESKEIVGVVSYDMSLLKLSHFLSTLKVGKTGKAFIINDKGQLIAHPNSNAISTRILDDGTPVLNSVENMENTPEKEAFKVFKNQKESQKQGFKNQIKFSFKNQTYLAFLYSFPKQIRDNWSICIVVPEDDFVGPIKRNLRINLSLTLIIFITAIFLAILFSNLITKPINDISSEALKIQHLDLGGEFNPSSMIREIYSLEQAICDMKEGLKSFEKYVPAILVKQLIGKGLEAKKGGEIKNLTMFFSDIENFTQISETYHPEELVPHLSDYLEIISGEIHQTSGVIDKFIGDAVMAFWGAPEDDKNHANNAAQAALNCKEKIKDAQEKWKSSYKPAFNTRIGLHTGDVIVGNIGTHTRLNYTVLGDNVNLASRIESLNKIYKTDILITDTTYELIKNKFICRFIDRVIVKGRNTSIDLYELLGKTTDMDINSELVSLSIKAFELYLTRNWDRAETAYNQILAISEKDSIARIFLERIKTFKQAPPPDDWNGTYKFDIK